jgi:hypothetical protein
MIKIELINYYTLDCKNRKSNKIEKKIRFAEWILNTNLYFFTHISLHIFTHIYM